MLYPSSRFHLASLLRFYIGEFSLDMHAPLLPWKGNMGEWTKDIGNRRTCEQEPELAFLAGTRESNTPSIHPSPFPYWRVEGWMDR